MAEEQGCGERRWGKGVIPEELQAQAKKAESPVVSELLVAARRGHAEQVVRLLREQPDKATITDKYGRTCLHLACSNGHFSTALAILQSGAVDISATTKRGLTPLHQAAQEGDIRISLLLLSMGADLHSRTKDGWTPLMSACSHGHLQLAQLLMAAGSDVNALTKLGLTPLHIAAWKGHTAVVEVLLRAGCNPATVAHNNRTAQQLAAEEEHHEAVTVLQAASAKQSEDPFYRVSALEGQLRICQSKLVQSHQEHEEMRRSERMREEGRVRVLQHDHEVETEAAKRKISELESRVEVLERERDVLLETLGQKAMGKEGEGGRGGGGGGGGGGEGRNILGSPGVSSQHKRREEEEEGGRRERGPDTWGSPCQQLMSSESRNKSASWNDLTQTSGRSPAPTPGPRQALPQAERSSITEMVAECLRNPSSMASIRNELKADGFTPKIERKFKPKATPTSLPAMAGETSPLARDGRRARDKGSQRSPRSSKTTPNGK